MIDKASQKGREFFESGLYCAESVLLAMAQSKGIQSDLIPKIATGFCGGVARTCGTCGAVSGAIMGIGLFTGRNSPEASVDDTYRRVRKLLEMFEARFGSTNCRELIGCDLGTEEGQNHFKTVRAQCTMYTEEATRIAMSIVQDAM